MTIPKTHYDVLRILPSATARQVIAAYRALALELHPDTNPSPDAAQLFKDIKAAYDVLSDPEQRLAYDALLRSQAQARAQRKTTSGAGGARRAPRARASPTGAPASGPRPRKDRRAGDHGETGSDAGARSTSDTRWRGWYEEDAQWTGPKKSASEPAGASAAPASGRQWVPVVVAAGLLLLLAFGRGEPLNAGVQSSPPPTAASTVWSTPATTPAPALVTTPVTTATPRAISPTPRATIRQTPAPTPRPTPRPTLAPPTPVPAPAVALSASVVTSGANIGVTWSGLVGPASGDSMMLAPLGSPDNEWLVRRPISAGESGYTEVPTGGAGIFEIRLWSAAAGGVIARARVQVTAAPTPVPTPATPPSVTVTPSSVVIDETFYVTFRNFPAGTTAAFIAEIAPSGRYLAITGEVAEPFEIIGSAFMRSYHYQSGFDYTLGTRTLRFSADGQLYDVRVTLR